VATIRGNNNGPIEINYLEHGSGDPLVLIGGITSVLQVWDLMLPELAKTYRVITPDNRGSGGTRVPDDDGDRRPARFAGDILALLDGLELSRVHLVGASMGGMVVQEFALSHPERLASLTICCSNVGGSRTVNAAPEVIASLFGGAANAAEAADPETRRATLANLIHPDSIAKCPDNLDFYLDLRERFPHSGEEMGRRARGIGSLDSYEGLRSLDVPTLVMTGSDDLLVPKENSQIIHDAIANSELVEIDETGHIFFVERPEASCAALLGFLAKYPIA
jgi:pimeloyl-ACP methyl ester carboxylesterase